MNTAELLNALQRMKVETGSLVCLGCGHEHRCGTEGCAILRDAAAVIDEVIHPWLDPEVELPADPDEVVLVCATGWPRENMEFRDAYELATYDPDEGWVLTHFPEWETPQISRWMRLPQ